MVSGLVMLGNDPVLVPVPWGIANLVQGSDCYRLVSKVEDIDLWCNHARVVFWEVVDNEFGSWDTFVAYMEEGSEYQSEP